MKSYNRIIALVLAVVLLIFALSNVLILRLQRDEADRGYKVDVNRIEEIIRTNGASSVDFNEYPYVSGIAVLERDSTAENADEFFAGGDKNYCIRSINGRLYRFDYSLNKTAENAKVLYTVNICLGLMALLTVVVVFYIKSKVIKPFNQIQNMPYELSRGKLTTGLKESKNRYFGRFVWGLDLLREHLEEQKARELALQKEKKTLILSLSHDIKTPLSTIKLYAKALSKKLYSSEEKKIEIAESINAKADEIESFVSDIIKASTDDFLNIQVNNGEFYLSELAEETQDHYAQKLAVVKTEFKVGKYNNCLLKGDKDRALEAVQNIMENAIKYGDGKSIELSFGKEEDCILLTVTNTGCALTPNELPHIFDSFWRGSNSKNQQGSGLGLYICKEIMRKMDGDIFAFKADGKMNVTMVFRRI